MNPTTSSSLDPKLKEVYDRVMGTSVGSTTPKPQAPAISPQPLNGQQTAQATHPPQNATHANSATVQTPPAQSVNKSVPPPRPASLAGAPQPKSAVDYAALAAKYATPPSQPTQEAAPPPAPEQKHATVTPSSTTYGVVNGGSESKTESNSNSHKEPEHKGGTLKKISLIMGILMFFVIYTFVWVVIFGFELTLPI